VVSCLWPCAEYLQRRDDFTFRIGRLLCSLNYQPNVAGRLSGWLWLDKVSDAGDPVLIQFISDFTERLLHGVA
jgi:hypothetical protein